MSDTDLLTESERRAALPPRGLRRVLWPLVRLVSEDPWRSALIGAVVLGSLGIAYWATSPRTYRGHALVAPVSSAGLGRLPGALSGLAGQFGLATDLDPTTTPAFYSMVARSEALQRSVLFSALPPRPGEREERPVWRALGIPPCDSVCILRDGLLRLDHAVDITVNRQTGTLEIAAVLRDPVDAAAIVNLYIAALERFNRSVRRTQTRASRQFLEERVGVITAALHAAEDSLQRFHERNADWQRSPRLVFEEGRLRREMDAQSELRSTLRRQLESARVEEVNSTPLLNIIDTATPPTRKYSPRGLPILIGALVTGGLLGFAIGVARLRLPS